MGKSDCISFRIFLSVLFMVQEFKVQRFKGFPLTAGFRCYPASRIKYRVSRIQHPVSLPARLVEA